MKDSAAGKTTASLRVPGEVGLRKLTCVQPAIEPAPRGSADMTYPIYFCNDGTADGGYFIKVTGGGFTGWTMAYVTAKNFVNDKVVANLKCELPASAQ